MFYVTLQGWEITCCTETNTQSCYLGQTKHCVSNRDSLDRFAKTDHRLLWWINYFLYLFLYLALFFLFNRRRSIQWISTPLPDWVYTERGSVEGLPEWALFWWVHTLLKLLHTQLVYNSDTIWLNYTNSGLYAKYCPLLVCGALYHWMMINPTD